ncbi:hypothetical protein [Nocardioides soli]|uniref:Bacterial Ig-like domain-containing protein n=1 Tax=Nocardioides soli TaxID=1036020 RepID=A0A7W4Z295_9ACTN|nr:hypothetical protein [Nocardioides soli]MBB3043652.1 hypothetical protein [Nocardioides soli]
MRFRKLAGLVVGALTVGTLVAPGLTTAAQAAPSSKTVTQQLSCVFGSFDIAYPVEVALTVDGTAVSATLSDIPPTGMPTFLKVHATSAVVDATVNGETVELSGDVTYPTPITNNPVIEMPDVTGTRTGTADVSSVGVAGIDVTMSVQAYGPGTSDSDMSCAPVAPVEIDQQMACAFGSFDIAYPAEVAVIANGTGVTATLSDIPPTGMPTFLKVHATSAVVNATVDGEAVELSGDVTYPTPITNNPAIPMPEVAGTRTGTAAATEVSIESVDVTMSVQAYGPGTSESEMPCTAVGPVGLGDTQQLTCVFGDFAIGYRADLAATVTGTNVAGVLAEDFVPGMPAFVTISKFKVDLATTVDGEAVTLSGESSYSPSKPGNTPFAMPALSGDRAGTAAPSEIAVTGAVLTMTASGSDNLIHCAPAAPATATTTTLAATSAAANAVHLAATVAPAGAVGKVEFREGATKVGESAVASGAASLALAGVAAGRHAYTATFVPTDAAAFGGSTSAAVGVDVAGPPDVKAPSATCTAAEAKAKAAQTKVKKTKANVKKAQAKVKKAKNAKKVKAAKKKLKAAKGKLTKSQKQLKAAKQAVAKAC